jgi:hypothetical protein
MRPSIDGKFVLASERSRQAIVGAERLPVEAEIDCARARLGRIGAFGNALQPQLRRSLSSASKGATLAGISDTHRSRYMPFTRG